MAISKDDRRQMAFLNRLRQIGVVKQACEETGVCPQELHNWERGDPGLHNARIEAQRIGMAANPDVPFGDSQEAIDAALGAVPDTRLGHQAVRNEMLMAAAQYGIDPSENTPTDAAEADALYQGRDPNVQVFDPGRVHDPVDIAPRIPPPVNLNRGNASQDRGSSWSPAERRRQEFKQIERYRQPEDFSWSSGSGGSASQRKTTNPDAPPGLGGTTQSIDQNIINKGKNPRINDALPDFTEDGIKKKKESGANGEPFQSRRLWPFK